MVLRLTNGYENVRELTECNPSRARKEAMPTWSTMFFSGWVYFVKEEGCGRILG
jgi:hypothetical protein